MKNECVPFHAYPETTFVYTKTPAYFHEEVHRIHFYSGSAKGNVDFPKLTNMYGNCTLSEAQVIVALGGDGTMLDALKMAYPFDIPVYGIDYGTKGYLLNKDRDDELKRLPSQIYNAAVVRFSALECSGKDVAGGSFHHISFNDVATRRLTSQSAHIKISLNDFVYQEEVCCDSVIVATPQGSTGYCRNAGGMVIPLGSRQWSIAASATDADQGPVNAVVEDSTQVRLEKLGTEKRSQALDFDNLTVNDFKYCDIQKAPNTVRVLYHAQHPVIRDALFAHRIKTRG